MPRPSRTMKTISAAYLDNALDLEAAIRGTRRLLERYRNLAWLHACTQSPLNPSIAPSESARRGAHTLAALTFGKQAVSPSLDPSTIAFIVDLLHHILDQVGAYPTHGTTYHHILTQSYFSTPHPTDEATMETLHLERSVYYSYKREAIAIFGLVLTASLQVLDVEMFAAK